MNQSCSSFDLHPSGVRAATAPTFLYYNSKVSAIGQAEATLATILRTSRSASGRRTFRRGDGYQAPVVVPSAGPTALGFTVPSGRSRYHLFGPRPGLATIHARISSTCIAPPRRRSPSTPDALI
jgi:hypothetical protein